MTTTQGRLESIYPAQLAIINNIAAYVRDLQRATSSKLLDLFASLSAPAFLLEKESNHHLLEQLLQAINTVLEHQLEGMPPVGLCAVSGLRLDARVFVAFVP